MDDVLFVMRTDESAQTDRYLNQNNLLQLSYLIKTYFTSSRMSAY